MLESSLQSRVIKRLKRKGFMAYKHEPSPVGMPDVHAIKGGEHIWFETKRSREYAESNYKNKRIQLYRHRQLRKAGDEVYVVWSMKQVMDIISKRI
jgi:Holliday junction resolvase